MILYNRLSKAVELSSEQQTALKLMLMRMAVAIGDPKKLEYYSNEITASIHDDQILHRHVAQSLFCSELCNNMAICLLYKGQVFDSMEMLKSLPGDPNEPVAINFSTIAELSISNVADEDVIHF
ncbi:unnamed protein product [Onchocerca flexuosa]|uniref:Epsilon-coat protein n=1 Tax=Onchocerca flexuosa TaxID=387005 RepID=A0A183HZV6_9BILA|nr:unnamed protein product [Onchocerca flexuosa]